MTLLLTSVMLIINTFAVANNSEIDSLKTQLIDSHNDSSTYALAMILGRQFEKLNLDSAIIYYEKAFIIADSNNWLKMKANALINIGFAYAYINKSQTWLDYLHNGLNIYSEINDEKGQLDTHYNLGYFYGTFENYPKSIESFRNAETFAIRVNDQKRLAGIYNNLGLIYHYSGQYDKANEYNFKSLDLSEEIGDKNTGYTHVNIALNYAQEKKFEKSLEHNIIGLELFNEKNEIRYVSLILKNIGDVFSEMQELDSAVAYYNKAYDIYKKLDDTESISRYYMLMGIVNQKKEKLEDAKYNYYKAIDILPEKGSRKLLFAIYSNICDLNFYMIDSIDVSNKIKLLDENISKGNYMLDIAIKIGSKKMETESYNVLYKSFLKQGNNDKAMYYANKYIIEKDSLVSEQKQKAISELQIKYETEKNELEIELLNSENELINTRLLQSDIVLKNQKIIIYLLIIGFVLVVVFITIIYRYYRLTKRSNRALLDKNHIISKQKEEKDLLIKEIHHRVKNNLQLITSLFDLQMNTTNNQETKSALIDGLNRVKSIGLIHQLLYQTNDPVNVDFKDFTDKLVAHIAGFATNKPLDKTVIIPGDAMFNIETTISLGLIINELLTNTFKYAFNDNEKCSIDISLNRIDEKSYRLTISDNGVGLPDGFNPEESTSLGLKLVYTFAEQLSGHIKYEYDNGAKFNLVFLVT